MGLIKSNIVFIAKSLDGYISGKNGELDWLQSIPNPENIDMGYSDFMENIDAIIMGRVTFETVCNFDIDWPYTKPVYVLSNTMKIVNTKYQDKAELINGNPKDIIKDLNQRGYNRLYIDGGKTIQTFLKEDLIDELIITTIPVMLGGGSPLFSELPKQLTFDHIETKFFFRPNCSKSLSSKKIKTKISQYTYIHLFSIISYSKWIERISLKKLV